MEAFLTALLKKIVANPQALVVAVSEDDYSFILSVQSDQADCGRIIGKRGKTINAIRHLTYVWTHTKGSQTIGNKKIVIQLNPD